MSRCPHCNSTVIQHSRSGNAALPGLLRLIVACIRCCTCCRKFYRPRVLV